MSSDSHSRRAGCNGANWPIPAAGRKGRFVGHHCERSKWSK
jgi:hypothetical protein